jgi:hypothetical protein
LARSTSDIDLLTHPVDRERVTSLLERQGYRQHALESVKHLPGFVRGDVLVEVHEAAFWTVNDWRSVRLAEMSESNGAPRLDQTAVHLVHHAFEGSAPTPALTVKTLVDINEIAVHVGSNSDKADAILRAARSAGLENYLRHAALALELVLESALSPRWAEGASRIDGERLIESCTPAPKSEVVARRLQHRVRALWRQPMRMKAALLRSIVLPSRAAIEEMYRLPAGSLLVWPAYAARTASLVVRAGTDAWRLGRRRLSLRRKRR